MNDLVVNHGGRGHRSKVKVTRSKNVISDQRSLVKNHISGTVQVSVPDQGINVDDLKVNLKGQDDKLKLKADRPHPRDHPHMPTNYRHTNTLDW